MDTNISFHKARQALDLAEQIIEGSIDTGVLQTNINQKLADLEVQYAPDLNNVKSQLAERGYQYDSEGINALYPPKPLVGVKADGTDDSTALNNLITFAYDNGLKQIIIPKDISVANTIDCKQGVNLVFKNNAVINAIADVHIISFNKNVVLESPRIYTGGVANYSKAAIYIDGDRRISTAPHRTQINNPQIWGNTLTPSGYGILFYGGDVLGDKLSYLEINNPKISFTDYAISYQTDLGLGYSNAFMCNNLLLSNNKHDIYLKNSNSHIFNNIIIQENVTQVGIILEGSSYNHFNNLMVYDLSVNPFVTIDETSKYNVLTTVDLNRLSVVDNGVDNIIRSNLGNNFDFNTHEHPFKMNGKQDDFLAYADKKYPVSLISGSAPTSYSINNVFNPDVNSVARWDGTTATLPVTYEIDFGSVISMYLFGVSMTYKAKYVKLELYNSSGQWVTLKEVTNNQNDTVIANVDYGTSTYINGSKARFTLGDPLADIANRIEVNKVFGYSTIQGTTWLNVGGGKVYGDIDLNKNKLTNVVLEQNVTASRPTSPVKGQMFYDTTLNKPIWYNGTAWTDAAGVTV